MAWAAVGHTAGFVLPCVTTNDDLDTQLRIALDFDGVLLDDDAKSQYADGGLPLFHHHETTNKDRPWKGGPLMPLLQKISNIQEIKKRSGR